MVKALRAVRRQSDQFLRVFRATRGVANPQALDYFSEYARTQKDYSLA